MTHERTAPPPRSPDPSGLRVGVVSSIVASILFTLAIQPLTTWLWPHLQNAGIQAVNTIVDMAYKNAALGHRNWVDVLALQLLTLPLMVFAVFEIRKRVRVALRIAPQESSRNSGSSHWVALAPVLPAILSILSVSYVLASSYMDLQLNTGFQQRLTILAPSLTEQEEEEYKARWASMTCRDNYVSLTKQMDAAAGAANIDLPEPL